MYDLTYQRDGWASESGQYQRARGTGGRAQKFIEDEPPYVRGDEFYLRAFWELSSERQFGQAIGPIPWSKIVMYGERRNLDDSMMGVFERVVASCIKAGLVGGKGFAVDASLIAADANKCRSTPGDEWSHEIDPATARRAVRD